MDAFPSPAELWKRYCTWKGISGASLPTVTQDYYTDAAASTRATTRPAPSTPRLRPSPRVKTASAGHGHRDRENLHRVSDHLAPVEGGHQEAHPVPSPTATSCCSRPKTTTSSVSVGPCTGSRTARPKKSYAIYLALYQAISGSEESKDIFKQFSPGFFDLIVVDECHRGSADANSAWREILTYFSSATQIGLTATPKETTDISTTHYFAIPSTSTR